MSCAWLVPVVLSLSSMMSAGPAHGAGPIDPREIPEALRPWVSWVLWGKDQARCPMVTGEEDTRRCTWPSRLELRLDERGGQFTLAWHLDARGWVPLPGDLTRWPQEVTAGRTRAPVVAREEIPSVFLAAGDHQVSGRFAWDALPEAIRVPPETGLLELTVRGARIERPNRQPDGLVFLQKAASTSEGERLEIVVHRKVSDENPLLLTTRIALDIAGKKREVLLGRSLPPGFTPLALESTLPARLEPDSRLRVQVRPGSWVIEVTARSQGPVQALKRPAPDGPWREGDEVWVFAAQPALRQVAVEGVSAIDPQQTSLPDAWKRLPAYPMKLGDTLRLVEKRRGDAEPTPDRLTLARVLWLDFDGGGFTVSDTITGTLRRATRLEMSRPGQLGRVSISGRDQFITHLGQQERTGVELRPGPLQLSADSRIATGARRLPAVGWDRDFHQASGVLHLPPGWRLIHVSGVDEVWGTWVRHWTLLEIFLALILALAISRLFGLRWGLLALLTFALLFPESGAPRWIWVLVLVPEALARVLHQGRLQRVIHACRHVMAVLLVLCALPFLIGNVRVGLYPALDTGSGAGWLSLTRTLGGMADEAPSAGAVMTPQVADRFAQVQLEDLPEEDAVKSKEKAQEAKEEDAPPPPQIEPTVDGKQIDGAIAGLRGKDRAGKGTGEEGRLRKFVGSSSVVLKPAPARRQADWLARQYKLETYDPHAMVQTGPGRPSWSWRSFALRWSGPVEQGQSLGLLLTSPAVNLLLALLRAALLVLLVLRLVPWRLLRRLPPRGAVVGALLCLVLLPGVARAESPRQELLDQLAERLLAQPECAPECAAIPRLLLEVEPAVLRARLEIAASAASAVPLPGSAAQWLPQRVLLDGKPASALARDEEGTLWLLVGPGLHQVLLEGSLPDQESLQLALPLKPHRVEARAREWTVDGIDEDGQADESLQLTRSRTGRGEATLQPGILPPFVQVERTLLIGLNWQVVTRALRQSPTGTAVLLEVPLLRGESVTTADVRVTAGKVQVNLGPQQTETTWRSVLEEKSPIALVAPRAAAWSETWRLEVSPIWHAELAGIPPVHTADAAGPPEWRPWPGETVRLALSRPAGVRGQTITIDRSTLKVTPGIRSTDVQLSLSVRSSRGAQHTIALPPGAVLESVLVDNRSQPIRQVEQRVTLSLVPGSQQITLSWREPVGHRGFYRVTPASLGTPSVNATTELGVSDSRWVLLVGGPRLGPVVLFWSLLLVLILVSLVLGRIAWVPLRSHQWMLLTIGLSQVHLFLAALVVGWLLLLSWRARDSARPNPRRFWFNVRQIAIPCWTFFALVILVYAVHEGLLGQPEMQIEGNGSHGELLRWFQDRAGPTPEGPFLLSVPLMVYRLAMLAWALWLAYAVLRWLRWGWRAFSEGGFWRPGPPSPPRPTPPPRSAPPGPPRPATAGGVAAPTANSAPSSPTDSANDVRPLDEAKPDGDTASEAKPDGGAASEAKPDNGPAPDKPSAAPKTEPPTNS